MSKLKVKVMYKETQDDTLNIDGVFKFKGSIYVSRVGDLIQSVLAKAHGYSSVTKMYRDLRLHYLWKI